MVSRNYENGPLRSLYDSLKVGDIDRRTFVQRASMLGLGAASISFLATTGIAAAQDASPGASPEGGEGELQSYRPEAGTEGQERGAGGELRLIQWQAATLLSPHVATGVKDFLGAVLVLEPLMHYTPDSTIIPNLVTEVPSLENGLLNEDLTEVTLNLLPDVVWSDGEPFTAEDVKFTVEWVQDPENNSVNQNSFEGIESVEVVDELTARVTFTASNPIWFDAFTGTSTGFVYPKHVLEGGREAHDAFLSNPIGTGPYIVESFSPNDEARYVINENYREPNKPYFSNVYLKGGGDAPAAARAVIQTGEYHFAWNLQVEPDVLTDMESEDAPGQLTPYPGINIERFNFNFSDPNTEVDGQRSEMNTPHPFFSDPAVREAVAMAIDRQTIADEFYGLGQLPAANVIYGDPETESPNTSWEFNLEQAAQILEDAGWVAEEEGGVRSKDGVELSFVYATSVNQVRQQTQAVVKSNLEQIGFRVQLESVDSGIYFDGAPGNEQNINHFYWDANMFQSVPNSPRPLSFMEQWYAGPDGVNIAQAVNDWNGQNQARWINEEYDALYEQAVSEADPDVFADLFVQMNDMVILEHVVVPLVIVGSPRGSSKTLRQENLAMAPFSYDYWNIANWNLEEGAEEL